MPGKWVSFDSHAIDTFYDSQEVNEKSYHKLLEHPNYEKIIECLTDRNTSWKRNEHNQVIHFPSLGLNHAAKI